MNMVHLIIPPEDKKIQVLLLHLEAERILDTIHKAEKSLLKGWNSR